MNKDNIKRGILASRILDSENEYFDLIKEREMEIKPSRILRGSKNIDKKKRERRESKWDKDD